MNNHKIEEFWIKINKNSKVKLTQLQRYEKKNSPEYIKKFIALGGGSKMGTILEQYARFHFKQLFPRNKGKDQTGYDHIIKIVKENIKEKEKEEEKEKEKENIKEEKEKENTKEEEEKEKEKENIKKEEEKENIKEEKEKEKEEEKLSIFIEQKSSGHWEEDNYRWQHIEENHKWNILLLCGIDYDEIRFWVMDRKIFHQLICENKITNQGNKTKESTEGKWFTYRNVKDYLIEIRNDIEMMEYVSSLSLLHKNESLV